MPRAEYKEFQFCLMLPSNSDIQRWKEDADKAGISCSKYIYEMVERAREIPPGPDLDVIREAAQSREELARLRRSLHDSEAARQKLETELFALRHVSFAVDSDKKLYSTALIDLLKDGHVWRPTEIMDALSIDQKNIDAIKALGGQLRALSDLKMIEETAKGWRWVA